MSIFRPALRKGLSVLLLLASSAGLWAATLPDLYETQVPAAREDLESRNQAIVQALGQVLVKLTGRDPAPGADELAGQAAGLVQQFRYERLIDPQGETSTRMWVRFDKTALDRAIRQRGLPLWGDRRPGVLVWLAAEQGGSRELVEPDDGLATAMRAAAQARGLPLQWPLLDLEDQSRLTAADIWSDYSEGIERASRRYDQPLVLAGRLRQVASDHWEAHWSLRQDNQTFAFNTTGASAEEVLATAVAQVTDRLAARYAPTGAGGEGTGSLLVEIDGIRNVSDYARVFDLLGGREVVDRVRLRRSEGDRLYLSVIARGGRHALEQVLDLAGPLERLPDTPPPPPALEPVEIPAPVADTPAPDGAAASATADTPAGTPPQSTPAPVVPQTMPAVSPPPVLVDLRYRLIR